MFGGWESRSRPPWKARTEVVDSFIPVFGSVPTARAMTTTKTTKTRTRSSSSIPPSSSGGALWFLAAFSAVVAATEGCKLLLGRGEGVRQWLGTFRRKNKRPRRPPAADAEKKKKNIVNNNNNNNNSSSNDEDEDEVVQSLSRENARLREEVEVLRRREEVASTFAGSSISPEDLLQQGLAQLRSEAIEESPDKSPRKTAFEKVRSKKNAPPGSTSPLRDKLLKLQGSSP